MASILTPLQLTAGAGLLSNTAIALNSNLVTAIASYTSSSLLTPYFGTLANRVAGGLTSNTVTSLEVVAANSCPALADSTPSAYASNIGLILGSAAQGNNVNGFTQIITDRGNTYLGNGDVGIFSQIFPSAQAYVSTMNAWINTSVNSQTFLGSTFTSMNSLITGNLTDVNQSTAAFGQDLARLGNAINLDDLGNLGTPAALLRQLVNTVGLIPSVSAALAQVGLDENTITTGIDTSDTMQKAAYQALTTITGDDLDQVLQVLDVTTQGLTSMADLLNPVKMFPNSFQCLTVPTLNGLQPIYINAQGAINSNLLNQLPTYLMSTVPLDSAGNPVQTC